jgi:large subunit ribosomal protein L34e
MVEGAKRSRTLRRKNVTTPGGDRKITYHQRHNSPAKCGSCGSILKGVPRDVSKLSKSQKKPERLYGGTLCSGCTRAEIKARVRQ